jgi:branched-chain amino acid aminotransferase
MAQPFAYLRGQIVPLGEAKIGVMTHAFNYGTACFEGIRGNWNAAQEQLFLFRVQDHFRRLRRSARVLHLALPQSDEELLDLTVELVERGNVREDVYIRPMVYKASEVVGVRLHDLEDGLLIFVSPMGKYLDAEAGIHCGTSSWRRVDDLGVPARAKVTGIYVNSALAKTEANLNGFDEAIMLTHDGHVSEGSAENVFVVVDGMLITPPPSDNLLIGITRDTVSRLAREELGLTVVERSLDRSELYAADELFLTGTAAHVSPVVRVDHRPVGNGLVGPITRQIRDLYFAAARGEIDRYLEWCTPVAPTHAAGVPARSRRPSAFGATVAPDSPRPRTG